MKAWPRLFALCLLAVAGSFLTLAAEDKPPEPTDVKLVLYHIQGSKTGTPAIDETIAFLKKILAAFPQYDTFHLLEQPTATLSKAGPQSLNTGKYTTTVTLTGFTCVRDANDQWVWKAEIKIECALGGAVIHNPTVRMEAGGQHTWEKDANIFVLQAVK